MVLHGSGVGLDATTDAAPKLSVMTQPAPADTLIHLRTPRDVLATVPRLLGYRPRESLVLLNLHDGNRTSIMRLDLPRPGAGDAASGADMTAETDAGRFSAIVVNMLRKVPGVRKTIIVAYTDEPFAAGGDVPRATLVRPLIHRLVESDLDVHDALCVASDAWGAYDGGEAGMAHRLDDLDEAAPGAQACAEAAATVDELAVLPEVGPLARRAFDEALDRSLRAHEPDAVEAAEAALALDAETAGSDALAAVLAPLLDAESRDVMLFTWAWGPARGAELADEIERIDAGEIGPGDDSIALDLLGMGAAPHPDPERIARAITLMMRLTALAADDIAHVGLTVLGWLHWSRGRGSIAARFVDRARALDPGYGLADLLQTALGRGLLANWMYAEPAR